MTNFEDKRRAQEIARNNSAENIAHRLVAVEKQLEESRREADSSCTLIPESLIAQCEKEIERGAEIRGGSLSGVKMSQNLVREALMSFADSGINNNPRPIAEQIGANLASEGGGEFGFVCIWRKNDDPLNDGSPHDRRLTVGEFLSIPENQQGVWLIDGGWGGPPGPIHVRWDAEKKEWENGGFCGHKFLGENNPSPFTEKTPKDPVQLCPTKDHDCGIYPGNWCQSCPNHRKSGRAES